MNKKVLLIDSDPDSFAELQRPLEDAGYEVVAATDGAQAIEAFKQVEPDLAVVDAALSGEDGFAVCQELKSSPTGNSTPILVLHDPTDSETIDPDVREASGCDEYAEKPLADDELLEICERLLEAAESGLSTPADNLAREELHGALDALESIIEVDTDDDPAEVSSASAAGDFSDLTEELEDNVASSPATAPATPATTAAATRPAPDDTGSDIEAQLDVLFTSGRPGAEPVAEATVPTVATTPSPAPTAIPEDAPLDPGDKFAIDMPEPVAAPVIEQPSVNVAQTELLAGAELPRVESPKAGRSRLPLVATVIVVVLGGIAAFVLLRGGNEGGLSVTRGVDSQVEIPAPPFRVAIPDAGLLVDSGLSPESLATAAGVNEQGSGLSDPTTDTVEPPTRQVAPEPPAAVADPKSTRVASRAVAEPPPTTVRRPGASKAATPKPVAAPPAKPQAQVRPAPPATDKTASPEQTPVARTNTEPAKPIVAASTPSIPASAAAQAAPDPTTSEPDTAINETAPVKPPTAADRVGADSVGSRGAATPAPVIPAPVSSPSAADTAASATPEAQPPIAAPPRAVVQPAPFSRPSPPIAVARAEPAFPPRALRRATGTSVDLRVLVNANGKVVRVVVKDGGNPGSELVAAAIDAVLRTKYQPAMQNGVAVKGWADETFRFGP